jgi:hypothetical protein
MDKNVFWQLIETAKKDSGADQQVQEQVLISSLAKYAPEEIVEFECLMREYLIAADDFGIMAAQKIIDGYVSDDPYLYFRCWLVGQGEVVFQNALQRPDSLATVVEDPYSEFEALLYVATAAYEQRTGQQEEDESYPREIAAARGLDYDFNSVTKGEDWTEEQLPKLLPKLWAKFG